jgi:hypothetical protein
MNLKDVLRENRTRIIKAWFETIIESYHADARGSMRRVQAQFTNPVGFNFSEGLEGIFDALLQEFIPDTVSTFLDAIIRIRAVQDMAPSEALSFVFAIKKIVREHMGPERLAAPSMQQDFAAFDRVVDDLALYAFDIYMRCREKIYDLKAQEARNMTFRLLQKAQNISENQE